MTEQTVNGALETTFSEIIDELAKERGTFILAIEAKLDDPAAPVNAAISDENQIQAAARLSSVLNLLIERRTAVARVNELDQILGIQT